MAEKDKNKDLTIEKETNIDGTKVDKSISIETDKPAEAPEGDEPDAEIGSVDLPEDNTKQSVTLFLDEILVDNGLEKGIGELDNKAVSAISIVLDYVAALVTVHKDPVIKDIHDDMVEQQMDGKTPDAYAAIARTVPIDEIEGVAGSENYDALQDAANRRIADSEEREKSENGQMENIDVMLSEREEFFSENNYDEAEKADFIAKFDALVAIFADLKVTKDEYAEFAKLFNYDKDMESLKSQVPEAPVKEVLPEAGNAPEMMPQKQQEARKPITQLDAMSMGTQSHAYQKMGKRGRK